MQQGRAKKKEVPKIGKAKRALKKLVACLSAVLILAGAMPALAAGSPLQLRPESPLTMIEENGVHYVLGPAADGGWTVGAFRDQFAGYTEAHPLDDAARQQILGTGYKISEGGAEANAVVKGDINGSGKWSIVQIVGIAKMLSNPSGHDRAQQLAADVNGDGYVRINDLVKVARKEVLGIDSSAAAVVPKPVPSASAAPTGSSAPAESVRPSASSGASSSAPATRTPRPSASSAKTPVPTQSATSVPTQTVTPSPEPTEAPTPAPTQDTGSLFSVVSSGGAVSNNAGEQYPLWRRYGKVLRSYLKAEPNGYLRVEALSSGEVTVERYGKDLRSGEPVARIPFELPVWGGCILGENGNYLVFGQNNPTDSDQTEVIRIVRYDANWNKTGAASVYGGNTHEPFAFGSMDAVEHGKWLYIRSCHTMYAGGDGANHQSSYTLAVDTDKMQVVDDSLGMGDAVLPGSASYYVPAENFGDWSFDWDTKQWTNKVTGEVKDEAWQTVTPAKHPGFPQGYTSHSFKQLIVEDTDGRLVSADLGDAYPRSIRLVRYAQLADFDAQSIKPAEELTLLKIAGNVGDNSTGATLGGLEALGNGGFLCTYAYNSSGSDNGPRDVYAVFAGPDLSENSIKRIKLGTGDGSSPRIAAKDENSGYILWTESEGTVRYVAYSSGGTVSAVATVHFPESDCEPIWDGSRVLWYVTTDGAPVFYGFTPEVSAPAPIATPTLKPTSEPSEEPTPAPSVEPSEEPTPEPSEEPTPAPSVEPSEEPTPEPSEEPTPAPSVEPSEEPTPEPSEEPTPEPSAEPTPSLGDVVYGDAHESTNKGAQEYDWGRYGRTVTSYLMENSQGGLTRVEYDRNGNGTIVVEDYDSDMQLVAQRTIPFELERWGGFFAGRQYNFFVFGQDNSQENNGREVVRIVKYDKDWNRIGAASLYGANTVEPFSAGSLRCAEYGDKLYVRTCHEMYKSSDGLNHQASLMLILRQSDMKITDSVTRVSNISQEGYVSHSFNQFVLIGQDGRIVTLDHGDAYPRCAALVRYEPNTAGEDRALQSVDAWIPVVEFAGNVGDNNTGAALGGLAESSSSYVCVYGYSGTGKLDKDHPRDVYLTAVDKNTGARETAKLSSGENTGVPMMVSTGPDSGYALWTTDGSSGSTLSYARYEASGSLQMGTTHTAEAAMSDCQPILWNGKAVWYVTDNSKPTFYFLDESGVTAKTIQ